MRRVCVTQGASGKDERVLHRRFSPGEGGSHAEVCGGRDCSRRRGVGVSPPRVSRVVASAVGFVRTVVRRGEKRAPRKKENQKGRVERSNNIMLTISVLFWLGVRCRCRFGCSRRLEMATRAAQIRKENGVSYIKGAMDDWLLSMRTSAEAEIQVGDGRRMRVRLYSVITTAGRRLSRFLETPRACPPGANRRGKGCKGQIGPGDCGARGVHPTRVQRRRGEREGVRSEYPASAVASTVQRRVSWTVVDCYGGCRGLCRLCASVPVWQCNSITV